jgi:hypothetical protein
MSPAYATSWGPREDVGVAAVDARTGKVLWEAWRLDEVPADASREERAAVEYLLAVGGNRRGPVPRVPLLPDVPAEDLVIKNPWTVKTGGPYPVASEGKNLIYYRHGRGVVALDRQTKSEAWRLLTTRYPYPSHVLEVGENRAFIQIGSHVPTTLHAAVIGGGPGPYKLSGLEPHTAKQRVAAAVLLHHYGDGYLRPELRKIIERLREDKTDPAAGPAAKAVEKLLSTWPQKHDGQRLLDGCVAALLRADGGNPLREFPWPEVPRVLAWCLLQELIYGSPRDGYSRQGYNYAYDGWTELPVSLADATRAELVDHCRQVVAAGPDGEKPFAASVLVSTAVGWARLTDAERKALFLSPEPSAWRWAAVGLAKNGRREQLMDWARERPADDHLDVIWVLRHDKPKEWSDAELAFWLACARRHPGGVASVLRLGDGPTPPAFREPIRSYLEREIAAPTVKDGGTQPAYSLLAAVYALDGWKNPDDTPLLLEYLKHPAYSKATRYIGTEGTAIRVYGIRNHVRAVLERRGVKVPFGVVYEEEAGPEEE